MCNKGDCGDICVVLSTYNGEKYLSEQVVSLESQALCPDRIHIRDDGSTDGTKELILELSRIYENITYEFASNVGWRTSFIEALDSCPDYNWYAFCDQDDVWLPEKLSSAVKMLEAADIGSRPALYAGNAIVTDAALNPIRLFNGTPINIVEKDYPHLLTMDEMAGGLTYVFNSSARKLLVDFLHRGVTGHDRLLMLICKLYGTVVYDFYPYVLYRQHGSNAIGASEAPRPKKSVVAKIKSMSIPDGRERQKIARGLLELQKEGFKACPDALGYLELVSRCSDSVAARLKLFFSKNIGSYCAKDNVKFRLKALFGGY